METSNRDHPLFSADRLFFPGWNEVIELNKIRNELLERKKEVLNAKQCPAYYGKSVKIRAEIRLFNRIIKIFNMYRRYTQSFGVNPRKIKDIPATEYLTDKIKYYRLPGHPDS